MARSGRWLAFPLAVVLVGINLRPALAAVGPLLDAIQRDTGLGDGGSGLLTTLPVALMGFCLLGTAHLKAMLGERLGIAAGVALILLAGLGRWIWSSAGALLVTAVGAGIGIAIAQALMPGLLRQRAGARSANMMGLYSTAIMGGALIASTLSPWIAKGWGWSAGLGVWMLPALAALPVWWGSTSPADVLPAHAMRHAVYRQPRAWRLLTLFGLGTGAYTLVLAWLPPFYTQLGWSAQGAGALLGAVTCAEVAAGIAVSTWIHRTPDRRPVMLAAIGTLFAGMLCLCLAPQHLAWLAALLSGLGIGALFALSLIVAMDHGANAADAGAIASFVQGGGYVMAALFPLAAGLLRAQLSHLAPAWWLMAGLCWVLALVVIPLGPGDRISFQD